MAILKVSKPKLTGFCQKWLFFDTKARALIYISALLLISHISESSSAPKSYFSRSDNILNQLFVKNAWAWNLALLVPYVTLTSLVYSCRQKTLIAKHLSRLVIATIFWFFCTKFFNAVLDSYGRCNAWFGQKINRQTCLSSGFQWEGFDISGHCFILIYGSLVLITEARTFIFWTTLDRHIQFEKETRAQWKGLACRVKRSPLMNLSDRQLTDLEADYQKYTDYIGYLFQAIVLLQILWDVMVVFTAVYFHSVGEKFLGVAFGVGTWFFTYHRLYIPYLPQPGEGAFQYLG